MDREVGLISAHYSQNDEKLSVPFAWMATHNEIVAGD
jgi:hypothetical protein